MSKATRYPGSRYETQYYHRACLDTFEDQNIPPQWPWVCAECGEQVMLTRYPNDHPSSVGHDTVVPVVPSAAHSKLGMACPRCGYAGRGLQGYLPIYFEAKTGWNRDAARAQFRQAMMKPDWRNDGEDYCTKCAIFLNRTTQPHAEEYDSTSSNYPHFTHTGSYHYSTCMPSPPNSSKVYRIFSRYDIMTQQLGSFTRSGCLLLVAIPLCGIATRWLVDVWTQ